ncbi:UNVERIFIED_ORG: toxin secretion/phage lysis holin [Heyndrickxia coagulans]
MEITAFFHGDEIFNFFFGGVSVQMLAYLALSIFMDMFTGILKSFKLKNFKSNYNFIGITKKLCIFLVVVLGVMIDAILKTNGAVATTTTILLIANEIASIIENLSLLGVKVPNFIKDKLAVLKEKDDKKSDTKDTDMNDKD